MVVKNCVTKEKLTKYEKSVHKLLENLCYFFEERILSLFRNGRVGSGLSMYNLGPQVAFKQHSIFSPIPFLLYCHLLLNILILVLVIRPYLSLGISFSSLYP